MDPSIFVCRLGPAIQVLRKVSFRSDGIFGGRLTCFFVCVFNRWLLLGQWNRCSFFGWFNNATTATQIQSVLYCKFSCVCGTMREQNADIKFIVFFFCRDFWHFFESFWRLFRFNAVLLLMLCDWNTFRGRFMSTAFLYIWFWFVCRLASDDCFCVIYIC